MLRIYYRPVAGEARRRNREKSLNRTIENKEIADAVAVWSKNFNSGRCYSCYRKGKQVGMIGRIPVMFCGNHTKDYRLLKKINSDL